MPGCRGVGRSMELLAFCVVALALLAPAPAPAGEYTPAVGQAGKDVIWVPTEQRLVEKMLDLAKLTPYDYLIDLGSGDGRTVITAAKRGARALGIEYNPDMVELSKRNAATEGVAGRAQFVQADIFASDFSKATVLTLFLLPELNLKLRPTILNMAPGTRVVSNTFTMGDWQADEVGTIPEPCSTHCTALLWIVPAKVAGEWRLGQGRLSLTQTFQMLSGTLEADGKSVPVTTGRVTGDEITFTAGNVQYAGWVSGKTMRGVSRSGAMTDAWNAVRAN